MDKGLDLTWYADADYGSTKDEQKSISGWFLWLGGGPISRSSKRQSVVALSSCEAEYIALNKAGKEAIWLQYIWKELGLIAYSPSPTLVYEDNRGTIALAINPEVYRRTQHIGIRYQWIWYAISGKLIEVGHIPTREQPADGLTKALTSQCVSRIQEDDWDGERRLQNRGNLHALSGGIPFYSYSLVSGYRDGAFQFCFIPC